MKKEDRQESLSEEKCIVEIGAHDVLWGRGAGPNEQIGNAKFRMIIAKHKESYFEFS
jgi:hypothetical protein